MTRTAIAITIPSTMGEVLEAYPEAHPRLVAS